MTINTTREQRRQLKRDNAKRPTALMEVPRDLWPGSMHSAARQRVFLSCDFLVQEFVGDHPTVLARLSVNRTSVDAKRWAENITWDELQGIKDELGYHGHDAVELYPALIDIVNVANMRHLWIMREKLPFAWRFRA